MLVLSRYKDQSIYIGDDVVVTIVDVRGDRIRLGIEAPANVPVHRQEIYEAIRRENAGLDAADRESAREERGAATATCAKPKTAKKAALAASGADFEVDLRR